MYRNRLEAAERLAERLGLLAGQHPAPAGAGAQDRRPPAIRSKPSARWARMAACTWRRRHAAAGRHGWPGRSSASGNWSPRRGWPHRTPWHAWRRWPTRWCAARFPNASAPWDSSSPTSTRSATTRWRHCSAPGPPATAPRL